MHVLKSIEIFGFRGQEKTIRLALRPDANFIVGRNGTGKTTLINLIYAALAVDVDVLRELEFARIELKFRQKGSNKNPVVSITRVFDENGLQIDYHYRTKSTAPDQVFKVTAPVRRSVVSPDGSRRLVLGTPNRSGLRDLLRNLYRVTWLSLQRRDTIAPDEFAEFEEDERGSDVDQKLDQVTHLLSGYFSRLDREVSDQTQIFQKDWFLSFLAEDNRQVNLRLSRIDFDEDRLALLDIFEKFNLSSDAYSLQLDRHFELARKVADHPTTQPMNIKDFVVVYDVERLHSLVVQWQGLQNRRREIYLPKTRFVKIASDLLYRKSLLVDSSNRILILSDAGHDVPLRSLSSGEKQLLIFLSETLLQEQKPTLFLADEPELSLHVEWQEDLVPSILTINPNAQVLFATHSPDVVNVYQANVSRMEDMLQ